MQPKQIRQSSCHSLHNHIPLPVHSFPGPSESYSDTHDKGFVFQEASSQCTPPRQPWRLRDQGDFVLLPLSPPSKGHSSGPSYSQTFGRIPVTCFHPGPPLCIHAVHPH